MIQVNKTTLSCSEQAILDDLMAEGWEEEIRKEHDVNFSPGKPAEITSEWTNPIKEIRQMSREHPGLVFTAEMTCMTDEHPVTHLLEFISGNEWEVCQWPNYSVEFYGPSQFIGKPFFSLMDQAVGIFCRVDTKRSEEGILEVDMVAQPVEVTVQDDELQVRVLKEGYTIRVVECLHRRPEMPRRWTDIEKELKGKFSI
jgi:hypothetical protein